MGVALVYNDPTNTEIDSAGGIVALCAAHPGPAPVFVEWKNDDNGSWTTLRSRRLRVQLDDDFLDALRHLVGPERVRLVKAK